MNILIIGNGFDLAHDLPTRYSDYVDQVAQKQEFWKYLRDNKADSSRLELYRHVQGSILFEYIAQKRKIGWVDFENELKKIVDSICELRNYVKPQSELTVGGTYTETFCMKQRTPSDCPLFLRMMLGELGFGPWNEKDLTDIEKAVLNQAFDFIELFKEYILWVTKVKMPMVTKIRYFEDLNVDFFLSFNYTPTIFDVYHKQLNPNNVCYVHGLIKENSDSQIVMGVGSNFYMDGKHEKFVELFKFFQRYRYKMSVAYQAWIKYLDDLDHQNLNYITNKPVVHIYGHSLDPTDKDVLLPFLELEDAEVWIYYYNESSKLDLQKNLVRILGKNKFCQYMLCAKPKISFKRIIEKENSYKLEA